MIEGLGISPAQWKGYQALLWDPSLSRHDLLERIGGENPEDDLATLVSLGLLRSHQASPSSLRPVFPNVALERLVAQRHDQVAAEASEVRGIERAVAQFSADFDDHRARAGALLVEELPTGVEAGARVSEIIRAATREILYLQSAVPSGEALDQARTGDREALARGTSIRGVYLSSAIAQPHIADYAEWLGDQGALLRSAPSLPLRITIIDGAIAIVPRDPAHIGRGALVVQAPGLVAALVVLFESVWAGATPVGEDTGNLPTITAAELDILRLLADGMKDDAISHKLGISVRTTRRALTHLYDVTRSDSRFELGVKAVRFGWL